MTAKDRYRNGQVAARNGRYEEALREYEWFHDHALQEQPALYGVRLSYALSDWIDLGKLYPPALVSLRAVRDQKSARLRDGDTDRELFHDVEAINESLGDHQSTYDLLVHLIKHRPAFAEECASLAMGSIVQVGDFALARSLIKDPEQSVRKWVGRLNKDVAELASRPPSTPPSRAPMLEAYVYYYAQRVALLVTVLRGAGEESLAHSIKDQALSSIESGSVRDAVNEQLVSGTRG